MAKSSLKKKLKKYWPFYFLALPGLIYFFINNYIPMGGLILAFEKYTVSGGIFGSKKVGFQNFKFLFSNADAWIMTRNTLLYNIVFILLGLVISILTAYFLHELRSNMSRKFYQTVILFPSLLSIIIVSYLANALLAGDTGFINNHILLPLGLEPVSFYSEKKWWPFILTFVHFWQMTGTSCILYLANMSAIDPSLYEAATLDGATRWQQHKKITIPLMIPTIVMLFILSLGQIFRSDFGLFYQVPMNQGALYPVTQTIDTYVYRALLKSNDVGMSSAASFVQSVVGFIFIVGANKVVSHLDENSKLF